MRTLGTRPTYWERGPEHGYHPAPKHYPAWAEHEAAMLARASELFAQSDAERKLIRQRVEHMVEAGAPAIMAEVANIPNPCKSNVEGVLNRNDLSYFNALLLATGVQRPVFSSGGEEQQQCWQHSAQLMVQQQ